LEAAGAAGGAGGSVIMPPMVVWLVLAAVFVWGAIRVFWGYPVPDRHYRVLIRPEVGFLAAVSEAMFPPGGHIRSSGLEAELPAYIDRWMAVSQRRVRLLMHLLFFFVEHATLLFPAPGRRRRRRFSSLSLEQRVAVLGAWGESGLYLRRMVFMSLRSILAMGYFAHPPVLRQLGVAPFAIDSPIGEADLLYPPIGKLPADILYTRDDLAAPSDGTPLTLDAPLHRDFAERTS
jgi:hypothetical protein